MGKQKPFMKRGAIKIPIVLLFLVITFAFFYKIFSGNVPMPLDTLTGMNFPWLDYKWGYPVGVPVKNPSITDAIVQLYPWRDLALNIWKNGQVPLWNPYSFSGTPLAANWQSAPFYPLNILMLLLGNKWGWTFIIVFQPFLTLVFTYLFLRELKLSSVSSILGAIIYSFSGFMMIFLEYNSPAQTAIWLPLILFLIEKFLKRGTTILLPLLSISIFTLLTAGNFQVSAYSLIVMVFYLIVRYSHYKNGGSATRKIISVISFIILGIGTAAIQILPTLELFLKSFRELENNIVFYNYGLVPLKNLVTFLAPDFFGNPVTGNSWNFVYHETTGYFGVLILPLIVTAFLTKGNKFIKYFFGIVFFVSLLLIFDTPVGKLVYQLHIPLLSTSYASRALFLTDFSAAILAALGLEALRKNTNSVFKPTLIVAVTTFTVFAAIFSKIILAKFGITPVPTEVLSHLMISFRNTVLPLFLIIGFLFILKIFKDYKVIYTTLVFLIVFDLFRFGLKYNTFTPVRLLYPDTPITEFLKKNLGYYRIDREKANIFPPNTWIPYQFMSGSGYDPLYSKQYAEYFSVFNGTAPGSLYSRYAELDNYNSPFLDLSGVKYLVVAKRDDKGVIVDNGGTSISYKISPEKFKKVYEDRVTAVLENTTVMPRAMLFGEFDIKENYYDALKFLYNNYDFRERVILNKDPNLSDLNKNLSDKIEITKYSPNKVVLKTESKENTIVVLTDSYYPGWEVKVDNKNKELLIADGIFRAVAVPKGKHTIVFEFKSKSFFLGLVITGLSLILIGLLSLSKNVIRGFARWVRHRFQ